MPIAAARAADRHPDGLPPDQRRADDRARSRRCSGSVAAALGRRDRSRRPQGSATRSPSSSTALNVVLYFFSGVALFVGGFLILNSFNMTVLQRMREIGMLRTLGASRRLVTRTVLIEALADRRGRQPCSASASGIGLAAA